MISTSPDINWDALTCSSPSSKLFCDFVFENNLQQFVREPTHCKGNILDLVLSNFPKLLLDINIHSSSHLPSMSSDHYSISISIPCVVHRAEKAKRNAPLFKFRKGNYILMDNYISSHDFSPFYSSIDVEFLWSHLKTVILEAILLYISKLKRSVKQHLVLYTGDIVRKLHRLKSLHKKATSSPTVNNILTLKTAEKTLSFNISLAKSKYESHSFAFSNNNRIYKYIRSYTKQSTLSSTMYFDQLNNSTDLGKATILNHYFHSVFSNNNNNNNNNNKNSATSPNHNSHENDPTLEDIHFTAEDVYSILANPDVSKAMGIDGIPNY